MNGLPRRRQLPAAALMLMGLIGLMGLMSSGLPARAGPAQPLVLEQKIPLGKVSGRIDHLAVDLARQRLFVAELGNDSLGVVDLAAGKVLRRIGGLAEPQGVAYDPASDTVFVADAGDGVVHRFTGAGLTPLDPIRLGDDADNVRLAPRNGQVVVGYGEGALALISAASGKLDAKIALPGHPESFQLERDGPRIFVNVPDAQGIVVVDRTTGRQVASWSIADAGANFPMALDEAAGRLLTVYRRPALLAVLDTRSGAPLGASAGLRRHRRRLPRRQAPACLSQLRRGLPRGHPAARRQLRGARAHPDRRGRPNRAVRSRARPPLSRGPGQRRRGRSRLGLPARTIAPGRAGEARPGPRARCLPAGPAGDT